MKSVIVGTAGHIDHGKSALVRALTGSDPDRLPEEKRRGITIDLGFAELDLESVRIGFVDVPGHERFVKNMLAGAHGIDLVALVVAADEGVMPQTREHFDICRLLDVQHGLIVITKTDLVEADLLPLVTAEVSELVAGSFLQEAPTVLVSAKTGAGLERLRLALKDVALRIPPRSKGMLPRLPVDRVFTMKGFGAVVTGTLVAGEITEGQELELLPIHQRVRARGLQVHRQPVHSAVAGQRTAINLGGIETSAIERGMVLAPLASLQPTQILDVTLSVLPTASRPLRSRTRVRFHIHAAEVLARVQVLSESGAIAPGETKFAQLRLEIPVAAVMDEHFIVRSYSPSLTIAGGRVLDPFAVKHRGKNVVQVNERLERLLSGEPAMQLSVFVAAAGDAGLRLADLTARTGWTNEIIGSIVAQLVNARVLVNCAAVFIAEHNFERLKQATLGEINEHQKREPLSRGLPRELLRERHFAHAPAEVFRAVLQALESSGQLISEKEVVRSPEHAQELSDSDKSLRDRLDAVYQQAGLEPAALDDAMRAAGIEAAQQVHGRKLLQLLLDRGSLVRVQGDLFFHRQALDALITRLKQYAANQQTNPSVDIATFKDLAGVSRKYAIPLLEFLDRERITRRAGDRRLIL